MYGNSCVITHKSALKGERLTDKHVNFAQKLVSNKYKDIYGLKLILTLHKVPVRFIALQHKC